MIRCFFCAEPISDRVFVVASISHRHGEILSRRYQRNFHRQCFDEFETTGKKPDSETRFVIGNAEHEIQLRGVRAA